MTMSFAERIGRIVGPGRIRTDIRECKVNALDIGTMPPLVKPFVPAGTPGAVVRPETEDQLVELVNVSREAEVPLVVRAAATSGYGGVLPRKGATVLDLSGWNDVLSIDHDRQVVRCQAGAIWEEVDALLKKEGFELCLYPSSYPSSTVGGWLAQGGGGFGSYEYGTFKDNVVSARVVTPLGKVVEVSGDDLLSYVADAEGITGVITEVTFKVRPLEDTVVRLASFSSALALRAALAAMMDAGLPLWSVTFFNPTSVALKKKLPSRHAHSYQQEEVEEELAALKALPESYLAVIAFPQSRAAFIRGPLETIVRTQGGTFLSDAQAQQEWEDRTNAMRLKRIGPSIIPTEVIVPLGDLAEVLQEIDEKIDQPFVLEGMVSKNGDVVLLGYIPHDERSFAFNPAFALSLSVMAIANAHGGSCYATGLYFRHEAERLLGREKCERLRAYKDAQDPQGFMNPGKVLVLKNERGGMLAWLMKTASRLEPAIRPIANAAKPGKRGMPPKRNGIAGDVDLMAVTCARCGYCVHTCEQYSGRGWESDSPRGKYAWIREVYAGREAWDKKAADTFLLCTTCERCDFRCQLQLPVEPNGMSLREELVKGQSLGTFPPFEMMAASLDDEGDIWAGKQSRREAWLPDDVASRLSDHADVLYFAGCTASYVETDIAESTLRLLLDSGLNVAYAGNEESCCGIPMKMAGKWDLFTEMYHRNVKMARERGVKTVVTSCPACALVWKELYAEEADRLGEPYEFEVKHYSEVIAPAIESGALHLEKDVLDGHKVTFHDSCHAGRAQGIYEPPRDMLKAIPNIDYVEMEHNREEGLCCGSVVTLVGELEVAPVLGCARLEEAIDAGADTVVAICPCCQVQLRDAAEKSGLDIKVDDLARVVANAAGYDIPTSSAYTSYMWSYFERFIVLMKPENMAAFMVPLFPAMLDAMPAGMGSLMRSMAQSDAGLALIGKMMPRLFPKMAPGIMDKVMPEMIAGIENQFQGMPEDMADLMPALLPRTMQSLMPSYMPHLVPYIVPKFLDYLKQERRDPVACSFG